jgi:hypothetical protein
MKNLLLIVVITFAILSCKKTDDNPVEPKDEWVLADSVEIFEDASIISLNLVKPLNYRYGYFYNEPETQYMILDSTTNFEYIKK